MRIALDAGAGTGQQDCAGTARNHPPCRLLDDQKAAERRYLDRLPDRFRVKLRDRAMRTCAGVVEHDIGQPKPRVHLDMCSTETRGRLAHSSMVLVGQEQNRLQVTVSDCWYL